MIILMEYSSFRPEPYLYLVREAPFRNAIAQIRASSHTLAIERGRYTRPKTPIQERLCKSCGVIEDQAHFILPCHINQSLRAELMKNIESIYPEFNNMTENEQIYFIFINEDRRAKTDMCEIFFIMLPKHMCTHTYTHGVRTP